MAGLGLLGAVAILLLTRNGIGLSPDSVTYIDGARSLARGEGFVSGVTGQTTPITHWPPLYSTVLAGFALFGLDPVSGARLLSALVFGLNGLAAGWLVWRHGSANLAAAMATSIMVMTSAGLLEIHAWAWSEPLFLLWAALGIHCLALSITRPDSGRYLVGAAVLVGCAALTRYLGIAVILAGGLTILFLASGRWLGRGVQALVFVAVSTGAIALWMLRNILVAGSAANRDVTVNPIGLSHVIGAARTASAWLVPEILPGRVRVLLIVGAVAVIGLALLRRRATVAEWLKTPAGRLVTILACVVVVYVTVLAASISLLDADVRFNQRMLSPVHFLVLVAAGLVLAGAERWQRWGYAGVGAVVLLQMLYAVPWASVAAEGLGYADPGWRESRMWGAIEELPAGAPIYSNAYEAVFIYTGRPARPLPRKFNTNSLIRDETYEDRLVWLRGELAGQGAVVVYSARVPWRTRVMPTEAELEEALRPVDSRRFPDGTLFRVRQDASRGAVRPPGGLG